MRRPEGNSSQATRPNPEIVASILQGQPPLVCQVIDFRVQSAQREPEAAVVDPSVQPPALS